MADGAKNSVAYKAFLMAQSQMKNAAFNKTNPHFKSSYADLTAVREATLPILNDNGLAIIQYPKVKGEQFVLATKLVHESGEVVQRAEYPISVEGKPQQVGSEITYARRYTWASICGIASDEDDDANAAQQAPAKRTAAPRTGLKAEADKIAKELKNEDIKSEVELDEVWMKHGETIDKIKAESKVAYQALMKIYTERMETLTGGVTDAG